LSLKVVWTKEWQGGSKQQYQSPPKKKKTKKQSSVEPRSEESNLRWEATSGGKARKSREEGKQVG
jgi:hypothetical protein